MKYIDEKIEIYEYPTEFFGNSGSITIGDLHGNAVKLAHFLIRHGVMDFKEGLDKEKEYEKFVKLYNEFGKIIYEIKDIEFKIRKKNREIENFDRIINGLSKEKEGLTSEQKAKLNSNIENKRKNQTEITQLERAKNILSKQLLPPLLNKFNDFMEQLEVKDKDVLVRLIGDELADRGSCDYFMLRLFSFLHKNKVDVTTMVSNHSTEFVTAYERLVQGETFVSDNIVLDHQKPSFIGLKMLLDQNLITKKELTNITNDSYKPTLKLIDYTLDEKGIRLHTHAPVAFSIIEKLASKLKVDYDDSTKEKLADTIYRINQAFQEKLEANDVKQFFLDNDALMSKEINTEKMTEDQISQWPLMYLIWNRMNKEKDTLEARPSEHNGYIISYVHGHDPYESEFKHVTNLDTRSGKGLIDTEIKEESEENDKSLYNERVIDSNEPGSRERVFQNKLETYLRNQINRLVLLDPASTKFTQFSQSLDKVQQGTLKHSELLEVLKTIKTAAAEHRDTGFKWLIKGCWARDTKSHREIKKIIDDNHRFKSSYTHIQEKDRKPEDEDKDRKSTALH